MGRYVARFVVPAEATVTVEGEDEDAAYDLACDLVTEHLNTIAVPNASGVAVDMSIDGVGGEIEEATR